MPNISQYALLSAALKAIREMVDAKDKAIRAEATAAYTATYHESGIKSLDVFHAGEKVATATLSIPKPVPASVGDRGEFLRWVREHHPEMIVSHQPPPTFEVAPDFEAALLSQLTFRDGQAFDSETGEQVAGIIPPHTPEPKSYSIKFAPGGDTALLEAWRQGALAPVEESLALTD